VKQCRKCGAPLVVPPTGRPPDYCGQACRRISEFEIRRLVRQLDTLDEQQTHLTQPGIAASSLRDTYGRTHAQQLADVQGSIVALEKRLRALIGDEPAEEHEQ
jgi:hypothetical protein